MIADLVEGLTNVGGPVICLVVGLLACAETAAFIGLAAPGELTVVFGGVLAYEGKVSLTAIAASAVVGAICGDSLGFYLGHRLGGRISSSRIGRLMGPARIERTMARIRAGGVKAIILGRFVGVLRAVMPFTAGASGMRYARFLAASVVGATVWGIGFTLAGYLAGNQWRRVEHYAGRASGVLAIVLVTIVLLVVAARKAAERQDRLRAAWQRFIDRPRIAGFRRRYRRELAFLVARFRPGPAAGLQLTLSLAALAILGYGAAVVVGQVLDLTGLAAFDREVRESLSDQPSGLTDTVRVVRRVLSSSGALTFAILVGLGVWLRDRRPRGLVLIGSAAGGAILLAEAVRALVERPNPLFDPGVLGTHTFPASATTTVAATGVALLAVLLPRLSRWTRVVAATTCMIGVVVAAGLAELLVADAYLSDVVGGGAFGALWAMAVATVVTTVWRAAPTKGERQASAMVGR